MFNLRNIKFALGAACLLLAACANAAAVTLAIPGNLPFTSFENKRVGGVIAEAAKVVLERMGYQIEAHKMPFPRMYKWIDSGKIDVATSVLATPERRKYSHYSNPIITEYTLLVVPRGKAFRLRSIANLHDKKIGGQLGFRYPPLKSAGVKLIRERSYETNLRKVAAGRIDAAIIGSVTGPYLVRLMGLEHKVEFLPVALGKVDLGIALNAKRFGVSELERFNKTLLEMQAGPEWQRILHSNQVLDLVKKWPILGE